MKFGNRKLKSSLSLSFVLLALPALAFAQHYQQTNLVSDIAGMAPVHDPNLKNPWGITRSAGSPWWVANNNSGTSTLYDGTGQIIPINGNGVVIGHLEHGDWLNAPWGVVWTTRDFGEFSNAILVGNFRSGWIAAYNGFTHKFLGFLRNPDNSLTFIDGLWSLTFGNDGTAGPANTLFFTAGINNEFDGLFGTITPVDGLDGDEE
jgi:hypothetical protein